METSLKELEMHDALSYLEFNTIKAEVLRLLNPKYYNNYEIAVLRNVVLLKNNASTYKIMLNSTLSILLRNPRVEDEARIEIALSMLDTNREKLERIKQLIEDL